MAEKKQQAAAAVAAPTKAPAFGWRDFFRVLANWWQPKRWARNLVFIVLLLLDGSNLFRFVYTGMTVASKNEQMMLPFGILIPMSVAVFDATAFALIITPTIYFLSDLVAQRKAEEQKNLLYWIALLTGSLVSGLANGGALYFDFNDQTLLDRIDDKTFIPIALGALVMLGLLFYASMEAWDLARAKIKAREQAQNEVLGWEADLSRYKSTPGQHRDGLLASGKVQMNPLLKNYIDSQAKSNGAQLLAPNAPRTKGLATNGTV